MEYEYMRTLRQRFFTEAETDQQREIEESWRSISERMSRADQQQILRLVDLQAALLEETSLESFAAGFQLAYGIAGELRSYSFAQDEEVQAEKRREH